VQKSQTFRLPYKNGDIFLHQYFWFFYAKIFAFFTPKILLFLHQILKFRKIFFGKKLV